MASALIVCCIWLTAAKAQPVTGSGAEVAWLAPELAAVLDLEAGTQQKVSLRWPRKLPARGYLAVQLNGNETAWVRLANAEAAEHVRFRFLSGTLAAMAAVEAVPQRRSPVDFVFTAPLGSPIWLGLSVRPGQPPPAAQIWVGSIDTPGFRWELWEEQAKKWAAGLRADAPAPPDLVARPEMAELKLVGDAVALAQAESPPAPQNGVAPLLRAEALLADLPSREPLFPYFRRKELTRSVAGSRRIQKVAAQYMVEFTEAQPLRFTVDGPALLRIEARAAFDVGAPLRQVPLDVSLHSGKRLLALAAEEVSPIESSAAGPVSSLRRILVVAAPGRHAYELRVRGGPAWASVMLHRRSMHAEDLVSRSEDVPWLLKRVHASGGVLAELLAAETSFLLLDEERAGALFHKVAEHARGSRLRAFALLRLAALSPESTTELLAAQLRQLLSVLGNSGDEATARLRQVVVAQYLLRVLAQRGLRGVPSKADVALLQQNQGALPHMLAIAGPLLRYVPGQRSLALPLLADELLRRPLDISVLHQLNHEWFTGTRWTNLLSTELAGATRVELLAEQREATSCAQLVGEGVRAYGPLPQPEAPLSVAESLAPGQSLHRFHLIALRGPGAGLGWADLSMDGESARLPLVLRTENIPIALAAGYHTVRASLGADPGAMMLVPCWLREPSREATENTESPLYIEHHYSAFKGKSGLLRIPIPEPGTPAFLGLELRASPALRGGRLLLRTDQGELGTIELSSHDRDDTVLSRVEVGPAVTVVLPAPAATRLLEITRQDDGPPILVRALLRRSLSPQPKSEPRWPGRERDPDLLWRLRQATRALRGAQGLQAQAEQRLKRAEILIALGALALARLDLEEALPQLDDARSLAHARALLASTNELPLVPPQNGPAGPRSAIVLAAGANLAQAKDRSACATAAVALLARDPAAARRAAAGCDDLIGRYVAARLEEEGGSLARAAEHYAQAYRQSLSAGTARPALAREGALRLAERGPGPGGTLAMALAFSAAQNGDADSARAVDRVRGLAFAEPVRGLDNGTQVRWPEHDAVSLSLPAALADEPWEPGLYLEAHPGQTAETEFLLEHPMHVRVETLCDVRGGLPGVGAPCELNVEADGAPVVDLNAGKLAPGERAEVATLSFAKGAHRIRVDLLPRGNWGVAFVHLLTSRPLNGAATHTGGSGYAAMPIQAPSVRRFLATQKEPVKLRAQGPTALRIDALVEAGAGASARGLAVELALDGKPAGERTYPVCTAESDRPVSTRTDAFDCRTALRVPLLDSGTYELTLRPVGAPRLALALSLYDDPSVPPPSSDVFGADSALPKRPIARPERPALKALPRPQSNFVRELGTLQVQQLYSYTNTGPSNPQSNDLNSPQNTPQNERLPGDSYAETSILYHRKFDGLPIWVQGGAYLRFRKGTPSYGMNTLVFARVPTLQLRIYTQLEAFTQKILDDQEFAVSLHSYLERSFPIFPHFFILPRFAFNIRYQSLSALPVWKSGDQPRPIDSQVFNPYNASHPRGVYGQLLLWWVPFINMITYAQARVISNQSVRQLDAVSARSGFDLAIHTTELSAYYDFTQLFADDARPSGLRLHTLAGELQQTIWVHRNHRLGLWLWGNIEVVSREATVQGGLYWEGSHGRGLDDYSTPVINLPQQLGRGRGILRQEETLR